MYEKPDLYYSRARKDYIDALPGNPDARILEIGCAEGATGAYAFKEGKCGSYFGIEIVPQAAEVARSVLTEVISGDVEKVDIPWEAGSFDVLIISEVLEHLTDPWAALENYRKFLKPGALVFASSPNVSHFLIVRRLIMGRFDYEEQGPMDRTHIRWFTPQTFKEMFVQAGYVVDSVDSVEKRTGKSKFFDFLTGNRFRHLSIYQINLLGRVS